MKKYALKYYAYCHSREGGNLRVYMLAQLKLMDFCNGDLVVLT